MKGSKNMSWVNLDDVYVNKSGDSIAGNLSVGGALTINDAKGTGGTYNVANEITTLRDSVSHVLAMPGITLNGTVTVPGLKNRASVIVAFAHGQRAIMPTADGMHTVSGVAAEGWSIITAQATATVSGEQVKFNDVIFNMYSASSLGSALIFGAGDRETIETIYG